MGKDEEIAKRLEEEKRRQLEEQRRREAELEKIRRDQEIERERIKALKDKIEKGGGSDNTRP